MTATAQDLSLKSGAIDASEFAGPWVDMRRMH